MQIHIQIQIQIQDLIKSIQKQSYGGRRHSNCKSCEATQQKIQVFILQPKKYILLFKSQLKTNFLIPTTSICDTQSPPHAHPVACAFPVNWEGSAKRSTPPRKQTKRLREPLDYNLLAIHCNSKWQTQSTIVLVQLQIYIVYNIYVWLCYSVYICLYICVCVCTYVYVYANMMQLRSFMYAFIGHYNFLQTLTVGIQILHFQEGSL